MFRLLAHSVAVAAMATLATGTATAQTGNVVNWNGSVDDNWNTNANWDTYPGGPANPFTPEGRYNEVAVIGNGDTVVVDLAFNESTSKRGPGGITVNDGTLSIMDTGELTLGSGTIVTDRQVTINDTLNIVGNGELNAGILTFGGAATLDIDFEAGTTSPITVAGNVTLGGALDLDYTGLASTGGTRTLITGGGINGSFSSLNAAGLNAAQKLAVVTGATSVQATVVNVPTLTIDRVSGTATLTNTHGTPLSLDGFSIRSPLGALDETAFTGLPRTGWEPSGGAPTAVADTYEGPNVGTPSDALPASTPYQVAGNGFWSLPEPTAFLQPTEEIIFEFTDESFGGTVEGVVEYTGAKVVNNNIVLYIDKTGANAGAAALLNESGFAQDVELYRISSTGSPLQELSWNPLADQAGLDNSTWQVSDASGSAALIEGTEFGSSNFDRFTRFDIGQILSPGFSESGITFEFLLSEGNGFTTGEVLFVDELPMADVSSSPGDFNGDSMVDARDYALWRENIGSPASVINDNGSGGSTVLQADFNVWLNNFGADYSAAAPATPTPEPGAAALLLVVTAGVSGRRRLGGSPVRV